ncbi:MAG: ribose 5-phosphate isomerase B [Hyphomicrobiaceae bacterium]
MINVLTALGATVEDVGAHGDASVDYPDYALAVGRRVADGRADAGVLLCGSGIGMSIAANKVRGVRAALVHDVTGAALSREHNDANVLCLGAGMLGERLLTQIVEVWMSTDFAGGRHERRVDKVRAMETGDQSPEESIEP